MWERPVQFDVLEMHSDVQVVHSLAKWKRLALKRYGFGPGSGIYTDMNAIRRDEDLDNLHSVYVDQWDWEKVITTQLRNITYLQDTVKAIVGALKRTQDQACPAVPHSEPGDSGEKSPFLLHSSWKTVIRN